MGMINKTYTGLKGLLSGMGLTLGYFFRFDKVITQQYPENRKTLTLPARTKSRVELVKDPATGLYTCAGCGVCVKACPNGSLEVIRGKDPVTKKPVLEKFIYHFERCTMCGLCVDSCHSEALTMGSRFESAVYDSSQLAVVLNADQLAPEEHGHCGLHAEKVALTSAATAAKANATQAATSAPNQPTKTA